MRLLALIPPALIGLAGSWITAAPVGAQAPADTSWDVTKPRGQTREIDFTTSEGTWTALDVSPDGQWVVFDLLGHISRMPIAGGPAECLTQESGIAINIQPRISPDGRTIAFVSDRKGQMNLWLMDSDGKNPRPVLIDNTSEYRWPSWAGNGQFLVTLKLGSQAPASLVMVHRNGGQGIEVLKGEAAKIPFRPTTSADGRWVYYDLYTGRGSTRVDALMGNVQLVGLDLKTSMVRPITAGENELGNGDRMSSGGAYAGEPSPDGRSVSFLRKVPGGTLSYKGQRFGPRSALWVRDLASGAERLAMDPVEMDLSEESFPVNGSYPAYSWTPDSKSIVIHQGGKIRRLDLATGTVSTIPFTARVHRVISEQAWTPNRLTDSAVETHFIRWGSTSPDGRTLVFQAFGRIWLQDLPDGTPRRLTPESFGPFEFHPTWSPDGQSVAFTSWHDTDRGALWVAAARGAASPRRVTRDPGEYANPVWSADGAELIAVRGAGATARGQTMVRNPYFDLIRVPVRGGEETFVTQVARNPTPWTRQGGELVRPTLGPNGRIYFGEWKPVRATEGARATPGVEVISVRNDGSDRMVHARIKNAGEAAVSPDGAWVAFTQGMNTYLAPLPVDGAAGSVPFIDRKGGNLPTTVLSTEGGLYPRWRTNQVIEVSSGNRFLSYDTGTGKADSVTVRLTAPRDIPQGSIALTGARIVTLEDKRVIPSGTVVVTDGRISCVGRCPIPAGTKVVSVGGKTIIPGLIDMHAHLRHEYFGMTPAHDFRIAVYLAVGVTSTYDPSAASVDAFPTSEMVETGQMIGPRVFTSSDAITAGDDLSTNDITSLEVARREVARRKSWGTIMLKQYLQPTRSQRQWVTEAARQLGIRTTAEGSADLNHKLSMAMDGHTGAEHLTVQAPLYSDFLTFLAKARLVYSHTPLVSGYGAWNEEYWWQATPVWQDAKQQRWVPWRQLIPHTRRVVTRPETDYSKDVVAQTVADLVALGGYSSVGSHGEQHGLGSHWDVWMLAKAAGPMTALEVASLHAATFLGLEKDLGSISVGKLADLMVLNGNPLDNIRNTTNIQYVMKGGTLYDATSLDEIWPRAVKYGDYYWVVPEMFRVDEKPVDVWERKP
jgi:Tol biopolymer transport system component